MFSKPRKNPRRLETTRAEGAAARVRATLGRVFRVLFVVALTVAGALVAVKGDTWVRRTPQFALTRVALTGNHRVSQAALLDRARIALGQNLFTIDLERSERSMAALPWVKSAKVTRRLPGSLEVAIVERQPAAMLALGDLYLVDSDGEPFKRVQAQDGVDLPIITGLDREEFDARTGGGKDRLLLALEAARAWSRSDIGKTEPLSEARLGPEGVALVSSTGLEVRLGEEDFEARLSRLSRVRAELAGRSLTAAVVRLDNRARPSWVTVQLSSAGLERGKPAKK